MTKLRVFSQRYPILFVLLFAVVYDALMLGLGRLEKILLPETDLANIFTELLNMLFPVALAVLVGYGFAATEKGFGKTFKAGSVIICIECLLLIGTISTHVSKPDVQFAPVLTMAVGVLSLIGVGVREEFIYRGVITNVLALKYGRSVKGLWFIVIVSGLVFGFVHMTNMFFGVSFSAALIQSLGATGIGFIFAAIYLRGGNIWFLVLLHAIIDASPLFASTFLVTTQTDVEVVGNLSLSGVMISMAAAAIVLPILLRKSKRQEIYDRLEGVRAKLELQ